MRPGRPVDCPSDHQDPPVDLSLVFKHPQGLLTARSIAKSLIVKAQRATQPVHPALKTGSPPSQSVPDMDPSDTGILNNLLTFTDPQSDVSRESLHGAQHTTITPEGQSHEMPDRCMLSHYSPFLPSVS